MEKPRAFERRELYWTMNICEMGTSWNFLVFFHSKDRNITNIPSQAIGDALSIQRG
jgi:hypothetical protein